MSGIIGSQSFDLRKPNKRQERGLGQRLFDIHEAFHVCCIQINYQNDGTPISQSFATGILLKREYRDDELWNPVLTCHHVLPEQLPTSLRQLNQLIRSKQLVLTLTWYLPQSSSSPASSNSPASDSPYFVSTAAEVLLSFPDPDLLVLKAVGPFPDYLGVPFDLSNLSRHKLHSGSKITIYHFPQEISGPGLSTKLRPPSGMGDPYPWKSETNTIGVEIFHDDVSQNLFIAYTADTSEGSSGGILFSTDGNFVGMHTQTEIYGDPLSVGMALSALTIKYLISTHESITCLTHWVNCNCDPRSRPRGQAFSKNKTMITREMLEHNGTAQTLQIPALQQIPQQSRQNNVEITSGVRMIWYFENVNEVGSGRNIIFSILSWFFRDKPLCKICLVLVAVFGLGCVTPKFLNMFPWKRAWRFLWKRRTINVDTPE